MFLDQTLILPHLKVANQEELFQSMTQALLEADCVKESFLKGITEREEEYPTGIEINGIGFAIPHTDSKHVKHSQICFASLEEGVTFADMTNPAHTFNVQLVFMLAMEESGDQLSNLQNLMALFQDKDQCSRLMNVTDKELIKKLLNEAGIQ